MPSKKTAIPVPINRWFTDVQKVEELRSILDTPTMQEAMATLKEVAGPSYSTINAASSSDNSHRYAWYAGYRDAFNDLHKLTQIKASSNQHQQEAWNHIQTPQR